MKKDLDLITPQALAEAVGEDAMALASALKKASGGIAEAAEKAALALTSNGRLIFLADGFCGAMVDLMVRRAVASWFFPQDRVFTVSTEKSFPELSEGGEVSGEAAAAAVKELKISGSDFICGIVDSEATRFFRAVMVSAKFFGAGTALLLPQGVNSEIRSDCVVKLGQNGEDEADLGLNFVFSAILFVRVILTACAVRLGKFYGNRFLECPPDCDRYGEDRVKLLAEVSGLELKDASDLLKRAEGDVKSAIVMKLHGFSLREARMRLRLTGGRIQTED